MAAAGIKEWALAVTAATQDANEKPEMQNLEVQLLARAGRKPAADTVNERWMVQALREADLVEGTMNRISQ